MNYWRAIYPRPPPSFRAWFVKVIISNIFFENVRIYLLQNAILNLESKKKRNTLTHDQKVLRRGAPNGALFVFVGYEKGKGKNENGDAEGREDTCARQEGGRSG